MSDYGNYNGDPDHDMWVDYTARQFTGTNPYFDDDEGDEEDDEYDDEDEYDCRSEIKPIARPKTTPPRKPQVERIPEPAAPLLSDEAKARLIILAVIVATFFLIHIIHTYL